MNKSNYWQRVASGTPVNRRSFLRTAALAGVGSAAFLAGCRSTSTEPSAGGGGGGGGAGAPQATALYARPDAKRGGQFTDAGLDPTTGWDPHSNISYLTHTVSEPHTIKLIRHDYTGIKTKWTVGNEELIVGELAEKWEQPDPLTYNMTLRKGLNWPNQEPMKGRPITAQDVEDTFAHYKLPTSQVQTWVAKNIGSVKAIDDTTVQFKLNYPHWRWAGDLDSYNTAILPKGYHDWAGADAKSDSKARGGGPWILEEYRPQQYARWAPNEAYRKVFGVPYGDKLVVNIVAPGAPRLQAWVSKQLDFFEPSLGQEDPARKARPDTPWTKNFAATNTNGLFVQTKQKPFDDVRVRRAMSMAVDREGWGGTLKNEFKLESGPVTWGYPNWKLDPAKIPAEAAKWLKYDTAEAKKLLEAAGVTPATTYTMHMHAYNPDYNGESQFLIDSLRKAGMSVKLKLYDYNNWIATAYIGKYDDMLYGPDNLDRLTQQIADRFTAGAERNHSNVDDADLTQMMKDFASAKSPAEAKTVLDKIQVRAVDQAYTVYRPQPVSPLTWDPSIQNYDGHAAVLYHNYYRAAFYWRA